MILAHLPVWGSWHQSGFSVPSPDGNHSPPVQTNHATSNDKTRRRDVGGSVVRRQEQLQSATMTSFPGGMTEWQSSVCLPVCCQLAVIPSEPRDGMCSRNSHRNRQSVRRQHQLASSPLPFYTSVVTSRPGGSSFHPASPHVVSLFHGVCPVGLK